MIGKDVRPHRYREVLDLLSRAFPAAFPLRGHPPALKPGILDDLSTAMGRTLGRECVRAFLFRWTREPDYLHSVAAGGHCVDLAGAPHSPLRPACVQKARSRLARRVPGVLRSEAARGGSRPGRRMSPR